jgi:putative transposase
MNNRDYKEFSVGECYHLYNRGNGKMDIFRDEADYRFLTSRLREYLHQPVTEASAPTMVPIVGGGQAKPRRKSFPQGSFSLMCYCLMPNHFHFLIRQNADASLGTLMLNLWTGYSKYFNKKYQRVGSLFQDQFKAVRVDNDTYLKWLSAYIHQNPTVAGLVQGPEGYRFSSYNEYVGGQERGVTLCDTGIVLEQFESIDTYRAFVNEGLEDMEARKGIKHLLIDESI